MIDSNIPLETLTNGQLATISDLRGGPDQVHRLEELGFRRGTTVEMIQSGRPCVIRVEGSKMCFRRCDRCNVLVTAARA
jgi:Fe2+ transport system protein FeoA